MLANKIDTSPNAIYCLAGEKKNDLKNDHA